ncbi:MAG: methyltransferase domain-containing protein [Proteobacteria bacterium]|nr:methyltransferase domain-containing protein [Pseudomonadota bacterium]
MYRKLKKAGKIISDKYSGTMEYFYLTPASLSLLKPLLPVFSKYVKGRLLDAGAGRLSYKFLMERHCSSYHSIDIRGASVDSIGDIQRLPIKDESFDSVFCTQVLEHVPEPQKAMKELCRVLKKGGYAIITVPHLAYLHNEPHDYYRYTKHGMRFMLERAGFEVEEIIPAGGLISFLGHIPSSMMMNLTAGIPRLNEWIFRLNSLFVKATVCIDNLLEKKKIYALNYIVVGQKK